MFVSMSTFRAGGPDVHEMVRISGEAMEGWLRGFDGYRGLLMVADAENATARVFTFWDTAEDAERSEAGRAQVRQDIATRVGATLVSVERYEVVYRADLSIDGGS